MQRKSFSSQQMVKNIRDEIRKGAKELGIKKPGAIKISLVPYNLEADAILGGFSEFERATEHRPTINDEAVYEYSYALNGRDFDMSASSDFVDINVKKRNLLTGMMTEGAMECVYIWNDFMDVTVRVFGAGENNGILADKAYAVVKEFFPERDQDFSIALG